MSVWSSADGGATTRPPDEKVVQDMLYRIRRCNSTPEYVRSSLLDFVVDGKALGRVTPKVAELLCSSGPERVFRLARGNDSHNGDWNGYGDYLTLTEAAGPTVESRTDAVMSVMESLRSRGVITGWRDELFPVSTSFYDKPALLVERAAAPYLGALEYGIHINGLVEQDRYDERGEVKMWMARRSATKSKYPGMLDHIVAGGQPAGLSLMDNVIKECEEEAGVPMSLAKEKIRSAGAISYETFVRRRSNGGDTGLGEDSAKIDGVVSRVILFCYDLRLPSNFIPQPMDGEVESFFTWSMDEVKTSICQDFPDPLKPNCYPVIIDYLLRMGQVSPETPGYLDVLRELRNGDCQ